MSFESLPLELIWLIRNNLDPMDLKELANTCKCMFNLLDPLLYQQALQSNEYQSKFLYAVIYSQPNAVSKFLKAGVLMNEFKNYLHDAPKPDRVYIEKHAISGMSLAKRKALKIHFHPLLAAAFFGNVNVIRKLLKEGKADINFRDGNHKSALYYAMQNDHTETMRLLLEQGAKITDRRDFSSPFVVAAGLGNRNAVGLMFNELQSRYNQLQLCRSKRESCVKTIKYHCGKACHKACINGHSDIVDFLLRQGVDVNLSVRKRRLLHSAATAGHLTTVKVLVKYGAVMECETDCGIVAAMHSRSLSYDETEKSLRIVTHLLRSGCNVGNGDLHACALWLIANSTTGMGLFYVQETVSQLEEIRSLLRENGFDEKNCRHSCWEEGSRDSLEPKLRAGLGTLVDYITNRCLKMITVPESLQN